MSSSQEVTEQGYHFQFSTQHSSYISGNERCAISQCNLDELIESSKKNRVPCLVGIIWQDVFCDKPPHIFDGSMLLRHFATKMKLENPSTRETVKNVQLLWNKTRKRCFTHLVTLDRWPMEEETIVQSTTFNLALACGDESSYDERLSGVVQILTKCFSGEKAALACSWIEVLSDLIKTKIEEERDIRQQPHQFGFTNPLPNQIARNLIDLYFQNSEKLSEEYKSTFQEITSLSIASIQSDFGDDIFTLYPITHESLIEFAESYFTRYYCKHVQTDDTEVQEDDRGMVYIKHILNHARELSPECIDVLERVGDICRFGREYLVHVEAMQTYEEVLRRDPDNVRVKIALASLLYESAFLQDGVGNPLTRKEQEAVGRKSRERTLRAQEILEDVYRTDQKNEYANLLLARTYIEKRPGAKYDLKKAKKLVVDWREENEKRQALQAQQGLQEDALSQEINESERIPPTPSLITSRSEANEGQQVLSPTDRNQNATNWDRRYLVTPLYLRDASPLLECLNIVLHADGLHERLLMLTEIVTSLQENRLRVPLKRSYDSWKEFVVEIVRELREQGSSLVNDGDRFYNTTDEIILDFIENEKEPFTDLLYDYITIRFGVALSREDSTEDKLKKAEVLAKCEKIDTASQFSLLILKQVSYELITGVKQKTSLEVDARRILTAFFKLALESDDDVYEERLEIVIKLLQEIRQYVHDDKELDFTYSKALLLSENAENVLQGQSLLKLLANKYSADIEILEECARSFTQQKAGAEYNLMYAYELKERVIQLLKQKLQDG